MQFEGDPASALVTFANALEAEAAFSAPDAVLGNRKVVCNSRRTVIVSWIHTA